MMLSSGYIEWSFWATREEITLKQTGHIQVSKPGYHEDGQADPFAFLLPRASPALNVIEHIQGVQAVAPRLAFSGLVSHGENTLSFIGAGIDPATDPSAKDPVILKGKPLSSQAPNGVLMGAGLAANLGVRTGDSVVLVASTAIGGINAVEGKVVGLASATVKALDDSMLWVPIEMARTLLRVSGSHLWIISLAKTDMTDRVVNQLKSEPALKNLEIVPWTKLADFYNKTVKLFSRQLGVVNLIIAIIIVLSISNTMTMSVMERTVEIGTSMALGVRRRRILANFIMEGLLLGVIGGILGVSLGELAAKVISYIGIPLPPAPGMSRGFIGFIIITPKIIGEALLLAMTTTLLASIYPARRASQLVVVDALRHNR